MQSYVYGLVLGLVSDMKLFTFVYAFFFSFLISFFRGKHFGISRWKLAQLPVTTVRELVRFEPMPYSHPVSNMTWWMIQVIELTVGAILLLNTCLANTGNIKFVL